MDSVHFGLSKEVNAVKFENDALPDTFPTEDNHRQLSDCISSETTCAFSNDLHVDAILFGDSHEVEHFINEPRFINEDLINEPRLCVRHTTLAVFQIGSFFEKKTLCLMRNIRTLVFMYTAQLSSPALRLPFLTKPAVQPAQQLKVDARSNRHTAVLCARKDVSLFQRQAFMLIGNPRTKT